MLLLEHRTKISIGCVPKNTQMVHIPLLLYFLHVLFTQKAIRSYRNMLRLHAGLTLNMALYSDKSHVRAIEAGCSGRRIAVHFVVHKGFLQNFFSVFIKSLMYKKCKRNSRNSVRISVLMIDFFVGL